MRLTHFLFVFRSPLSHWVLTGLVGIGLGRANAEDFFLTIGGGYAPSGNQASLERNVLYFQRVLREQQLDASPHAIFFADGKSSERDLQVIDRESVPKANRLMAEFFGDSEDLGLSYRDHQVPEVRGSTRPENLRQWFSEVGSRIQGGDRLIIYVTAHGNQSSDRRDPYNTTIATWNNTSLPMKELVRLLDGLDREVQVIAIMVQCHAGGFSRFMFNEGDPDKGLSAQRRIGFFATVHDRSAAGCTAEIDEASYVEYSTYFWAALSGRDRAGRPVDPPDYDGDGSVTFEEAHAYVILNADTIDLPMKTSGEYLTVHSKFGDGDSELLTNDEPYESVLELATPVQQAMLEGLSSQLDLTGNDRLADAWKETQSRGDNRDRRRGRRPPSPQDRLRMRISSDVKNRWPELANVLNPISVELVTSRAEEFLDAIENHPDYERYRQLQREAEAAPDESKRRVKFHRFLRVADNVLLAENLRRMKDEAKLRELQAILEADRGRLR
jgi:hypothetical protein